MFETHPPLRSREGAKPMTVDQHVCTRLQGDQPEKGDEGDQQEKECRQSISGCRCGDGVE
jgi:hypothetical protein